MVNVSVQQGNVSFRGTLQHVVQRSPIVKAVSRLTGVCRVVDQMQHTVKKATRPDANQNVHLPQQSMVVESPSVTVTVDPTVDHPADEQPRPE